MKLTRNKTQAIGLFAALMAVLVALPAIAVGHGAETSDKPAKSDKQKKSGKKKGKKNKRKAKKVNIDFAATAGKTPVSCSEPITSLGTTGATADLMDLRFYVSDVKLLKKNGKGVPVKLKSKAPWSLKSKDGDVTLIDLENGKGACAGEGTKATNSRVRGKVPAGKYVGAKWTIGVPPALSHSDVTGAKAPLNVTAMAWSWQYGRKFMKVELTDPDGPTGSWSESAFLIHLGSVGCTGNPAVGENPDCTAANRSKVKLGSFNPKRQTVAVDLERLFEGNDVTANAADAPGCMSGQTDPECEGVFGALGIDWSADGSGSGKPNGKQTVFRAIRG